MKPFKGPRHQRGWIGIAAAVVGGIASSYSSQSAADKKNKTDYQSQKDLSNLSFQQQNWLAQQSHVWDEEAYQQKQNYTEDAVRSFAPYAGPNQASPTGAWQAAPARTDVSSQTAGLAPTQANGQPAIIDPRTGQPVNANAPPLSQFG